MIATGDTCKFHFGDYKIKCKSWSYPSSTEKLYEVSVKELKLGRWVLVYHTLTGPMLDSYDKADNFLAEKLDGGLFNGTL